MNDWPNQVRFVEDTLAAIDRGVRRPLVTSPTGTGKSRAACKLIDRLVDAGYYVSVYSNRNLLIDQLEGVLDAHGIDYSTVGAGRKIDKDDIDWPVRIASLPAVKKQVLQRGQAVHGAGRKAVAFVDEAHLNAGPKDCEVYDRHEAEGHTVIGSTATPLDLGHVYGELLVVGSLKEGRDCGALMLAEQYSPDEPDWKAFRKANKKVKIPPEGQDPSENMVKAVMGSVVDGQPDALAAKLYGRIWSNFQKINPDRRPTIVFAPDIAGSLWIAEQFSKQGLKAAHIDGEHIWVDGELHGTGRALRRQVLDDSRDGKIKVLCNRFVLREGIDAPWLGHGVFATVFGSLQTYLQSAGRLLRYHPSLSKVTLQDHGGNCFRFGSVNADREWFLEQTAAAAVGLRADRIRRGDEAAPFRCPQCNRVWPGKGRTCSVALGGCGYELRPKEKYSRMVVTATGELRLSEAQVFAPRKICETQAGRKAWTSMYYRACSKKWDATFRQAMAVFAEENWFAWPNPTWPLMPIDARDAYRRVVDVPLDRLYWDESDPGLPEKVKSFLRKHRPEVLDEPAAVAG